MTKELTKTHLKSAALTFIATLSVELYAAMGHAEHWSDIVWVPIISAVTLTAARAALKVLIQAGVK